MTLILLWRFECRATLTKLIKRLVLLFIRLFCSFHRLGRFWTGIKAITYLVNTFVLFVLFLFLKYLFKEFLSFSLLLPLSILSLYLPLSIFPCLYFPLFLSFSLITLSLPSLFFNFHFLPTHSACKSLVRR